VRLLLAICVSLLANGCASSPKALPEQPNAPTSEGIVATVGKQWDTADQKVAAAISIARENADKPAVVRGETAVALSFLPAPEPGELALARTRAAKPEDQKAYGDAVAYGKKLLASIDANFAALEAQQKEALRVSQLKDSRIEELTAEVERVKQEASKNIWTLTGAGLAVIGALAFAFGGGPRVGLPLLLCGAFCGSVPFIIDSPYFLWVAIGTAAIAAGLGLWWLWDKVHDAVQDKNDDETLFNDDAHEPPQK
jgi:hypothetical protein